MNAKYLLFRLYLYIFGVEFILSLGPIDAITFLSNKSDVAISCWWSYTKAKKLKVKFPRRSFKNFELLHNQLNSYSNTHIQNHELLSCFVCYHLADLAEGEKKQRYYIQFCIQQLKLFWEHQNTSLQHYYDCIQANHIYREHLLYIYDKEGAFKYLLKNIDMLDLTKTELLSITNYIFHGLITTSGTNLFTHAVLKLGR